MTDLFLGIDGGGTKTHAAVTDASGRVLGLGNAATGNWERVGLAGTVSALIQAIDEALAQAGGTRSAVVDATFALAGIDWDSDAETMRHVVAGFGLGCSPRVVNDAFAVLLAGTDDGIGCASVAGTGGKTVGYDGRQVLDTLGMGLGEGGGAGQLVDETLRQIALAYHGQRGPTALTAAALGISGYADTATFFEAIARSGHRLPESFAPTVFELADLGDTAAVEAVELVARQHARDVVGVVNRLDFAGRHVPLVCAGGLHTAGSPVFAAAFASGLAGSRWTLDTRVLDVVPVVGAVVDAMRRSLGAVGSEQRERLWTSAALLQPEGLATLS